jgi:hypothetical protein
MYVTLTVGWLSQLTEPLSANEGLWCEHKGACITGGATSGDVTNRLNMEKPGWEFVAAASPYPHRPVQEHSGAFLAPQVPSHDVAHVLIHAENVQRAHVPAGGAWRGGGGTLSEGENDAYDMRLATWAMHAAALVDAAGVDN